MKWTGLNELRESYLKFFESKGHLRMDSAPLVPQGDNSVLLINAGMTPLKKFFQGVETPPCKRVTTCQKCIRTPDIDNVGKTARHGTYFEMLGNFSFGDYFKHEATAWAWEYLTKVLEIPADKLWVTVYEQDGEAADIWADEVGVPRDRIVKLGKKDNFWEHGSGPCGPCSEIHFDRGEKYGPFESFEQAGECDRIIEIWNLVFTQYDNDGKGNYSQLANKNIDTGMGLERLACVMQGVDNMFEVDTIRNIINRICGVSGKAYGENRRDDVSIRVITDHARASTFMVGDGVRPSNEGRGYVLRRLLRRAARHGRLLGINRPFLSAIVDQVIEENKYAYPELEEKREYIKKVIATEEESFNKTVEKGFALLMDMIDRIGDSGMLSGDDAFRLHDTYGFPLDLTREILEEKSLALDEERFKELMINQKQTARANQAFKGGWDEASMSGISGIETSFVGYDTLSADARLVAMMADGETVNTAGQGDSVLAVIDKTPFYAEMGGQVGDRGIIASDGGLMRVLGTKKTASGQFVCECEVESGTFFVGDEVKASVEEEMRRATERNHTCCHLLQAALRRVLGEHVHQAGSYVDPYRCRFDFSHFSAVTADELAQVEKLVNEEILKGVKVVARELPIEEARKTGAMALFGEKYGSVVRVVSTEDGFSTEFCGGTHLRNTANAGLFKIVSESSVASGVRRIEGVSGAGVLRLFDEINDRVKAAAGILKLTDSSQLADRIVSIVEENKDLEKLSDSLRKRIADGIFAGMLKQCREVCGVKVMANMLSNVGADMYEKFAEGVSSIKEPFVMLMAGTADEKPKLLCCCSSSAVAMGANAGKLVREAAAITGGKGGGRPDMAMAGVGDKNKIDEAIHAFNGIVEKMLSK